MQRTVLSAGIRFNRLSYIQRSVCQETQNERTSPQIFETKVALGDQGLHSSSRRLDEWSEVRSWCPSKCPISREGLPQNGAITKNCDTYALRDLYSRYHQIMDFQGIVIPFDLAACSSRRLESGRVVGQTAACKLRA